jgi:hypothetical protein
MYDVFLPWGARRCSMNMGPIRVSVLTIGVACGSNSAAKPAGLFSPAQPQANIALN